jgi:hypothetical protein
MEDQKGVAHQDVAYQFAVLMQETQWIWARSLDGSVKQYWRWLKLRAGLFRLKPVAQTGDMMHELSKQLSSPLVLLSVKESPEDNVALHSVRKRTLVEVLIWVTSLLASYWLINKSLLCSELLR